MKAVGVVAAMAVGLGATSVAWASEDLAKANGCLSCHSIETKKMGPSFKSVAAKYKGNAAAEGKLVEKLSKAQDHPEVKAKGDDLQKLVHWVVTL
jgi:cytochrome c